MRLIYCTTKLKKALLCILGLTAFLLVGNLAINHLKNNFEDRYNTVQVARQIQSEAIPAASPDFFIEYRLERDKVRSERTELLRDIIKNASTEDARLKAQDSLLKMVIEKQKESDIENLIRARGFNDALVILRDNSASAVIKTVSISREDVVQVSDIIGRVAGIKAEDITVSAKP